MLNKLHIKNVALISELELDFCSALNIMSGETGAGKSIIVDSLMLLLGGKYDKTLLRFSQPQGFVEGVFDIPESLKPKVQEFGLEDDDILVVNRKFNSDGKNEIRVNGKIFTTSMLKNLMTSFVDIYGQNEYQSLSKQSEHLRILDYFLKDDAKMLFSELESEYRNYRAIKAEMNELGNLSERERNIDIYRYQIEEIEHAKIKPNEEQEIAEKRKFFSSGERIATSLSDAANALYENVSGETASALIAEAMNALSAISDIKPIFGEMYERLNSVSIEIDDIADTALNELNDLNFDEREIDRVEKRYDVILSLKRKYGSYEKMIKFLSDAKATLEKLENCTELYENLTLKKAQSVAKLYNLSKTLSDMRKKKADELSKQIISELNELGMENSRFEIVFNELPTLENCEDQLSPKGFDKPEFYLSPNAGQPLKPLVKIISGGEMSRFMLALKVITSQTDDIPTLIFDEIDTGISGLIGQAVAKKLAKIARHHQVLCVSHLAQIASMADNHYYISKYAKNEQTFTSVSLLDERGMIEEISRLSGSKDISSQTTKNAEEMKNWSNTFKKTIK